MSVRLRKLATLTLFAATLLACGVASAQFDLTNLAPAPGDRDAKKDKDGGPVTVQAAIYAPTKANPEPRLVVTATVAKGRHIYAITQQPGGPIATKLTVDPQEEVKKVGPFSVSPAPKKHKDASFPDLEWIEEHRGTVKWTAPLDVADEMSLKDLKLSGSAKFQVCDDETGTCMPPKSLPFVAELTEEKEPAQAALGFDPTQIKTITAAQAGSQSLWWLFGLSIVGGFILNFMPCVLPVIGLKIFSFVEQAGHDRKEILTLNLWYSLGLMSVFMVLATVAVAAKLIWGSQFGWGNQFAYPQFTIPVTAIVFVMALSFLGVWEIPIPGFAGGKTAHALSSREGPFGAFSKGAFATVLATPCTGPFVGTALSLVAVQPPLITYGVFAAIGLGMAMPYLVIGAFPQMLRMLPKPGAWMETFKQILGFVLIGTAVYLLTVLRWYLVIPTLTFLAGLGVSCWWIGRTPMYAAMLVKARTWGVAIVIGGLSALFAFGWLADEMKARFDRLLEREIARAGVAGPAGQIANRAERGPNELPWRPFSRQALQELTAAGHTVVVDFTADWCPNCKFLERTVLNTEGTKKLVEDLNAIPLVADITDLDSSIAEQELLLALTGSTNIPALAIFPADRPNEVIRILDMYTQNTLHSKLREAGPSRIAAADGAGAVQKR